MGRRLGCLCLLLWGGLLLPKAEARDVRLALLVANEAGWGKEPRLKGAITGDLVPFARELRKKLGFHVLTVSNGTADEVRQAFLQIQERLKQAPAITTFLFFYSGHADKKHFHLRKHPGIKHLGYREFLSFFLRLRVKRRIALLDACDSSMVIPAAAWHTSGRRTRLATKGTKSPLKTIQRLLREKERYAAKGFRKRKVDIQTIPMMTEEQTSGLHIIASNGNAYHNNKLGASVFTRHFLYGLRGAADNNRDGKITLDELYDFARVKAKAESGQEMDRLVFFRGSYTFAPHFRSHLLVSSHIKGKLTVSVGDFTFQYHKKKTQNALQLPMMNGKGSVYIEHKRRCWFQRVFLPASGKAKLTTRGKKVPCTSLKQHYAEKGEESVFLPASASRITYRPTPSHGLDIAAGFATVGSPPLRIQGLHLSLHYRWRGFLGIGLEYEVGRPLVNYTLHRNVLVLEPGYLFRFSLPLEVFVGIYGRAGAAWGVTQGRLIYAPTFGAGGQLAWAFFFSPRLGLRLTGRAGFNYTPVETGSTLSFHWSVRCAGVLRFD